MAEEERYLGGFTAGLMKTGRKYGIWGYGIYATTRRIIGVKSKKGVLQAVAGSGLMNLLGPVKDDFSDKAIAELEKRKDFEVNKEDILEIAVTRGKGHSPGYFKITRKSGERIERINVWVGNVELLKSLRDLMKAFYPEKLRVEGLDEL